MLVVRRCSGCASQIHTQTHDPASLCQSDCIDTLLDINTQQRHPADSLKLNDIATVSINVQQALAADA
jgi:sulfate adenylyltransferase subunit 1 (EFTu-like GTPase family)